MSGMVLSLFPGMDVLGMGFEAEGFCVVKGPDVILGGDIRTWDARALAGRVDGIIGGDPCQSHSSLANLVRAKGLEPKFGDLTGEYQRIVEEVRPAWFLRENVPKAPDVKPLGYDVRSFLLDNWASLGEEQQRRRRFWWGVAEGHRFDARHTHCLRCGERGDFAHVPCRAGPAPELRRWIDFALELPAEVQAVAGDARGVSVAVGGSGKVKATAGKEPPRTLAEMLELQGLPADALEHSPLTMQGKRKLVGNAVTLPMAKALARAVRLAMEDRVLTAGETLVGAYEAAHDGSGATISPQPGREGL